jgi:hypothetical protein
MKTSREERAEQLIKRDTLRATQFTVAEHREHLTRAQNVVHVAYRLASASAATAVEYESILTGLEEEVARARRAFDNNVAAARRRAAQEDK